MESPSRAALHLLSRYIKAAQGEPGRSRSGALLRFGSAMLGLLMLVTAPRALAIPIQAGFNSVYSFVSTGAVSMTAPSGVALDPSGNLYISDAVTGQLAKVAADGTASVVNISGIGTINGAYGVAIDSVGNVYVADVGNSRVIKVAPDGSGTVLDTGAAPLNAPESIAIDYAGTIYIANANTNSIVKVPVSGPASVLNISGVGGLFIPYGIGVDVAGNLYISDTGNNRIVEVAGAATGGTAGTVVTINGPALLLPQGVVSDGAGGLYISDSGNNRIVHVAPDGTGTVVPTGGYVSANWGITRSAGGTLYVANSGVDTIARIDDTAVDFGKVQLGDTTGTTLTLHFTIPNGVTVQAVEILTYGASSKDFVSGVANPCIAAVVVHSCAPINSTCAGATNTTCLVGVTFLPAAPGLREGAVVLVDGSGAPLYTVPLHGIGSAPVAAGYPGTASLVNSGNVTISDPFKTVQDAAGNLYVSAYGGAAVYKIPAGGGTATQVNTGLYALNGPTGLALDGAGNLFIADYGNERIVVVMPDGTVNLLSISNLQGGLSAPVDMAFGPDGSLYVDDYYNGRYVRINALTVTDAGASGSGAVVPINGFTLNIDGSTGFAVDPSGTLYIADYPNARIIKVDSNGVASLLSLPGYTLSEPLGVAADSVGNLYIFDSGNLRILQRTSAGVVNVIALPGYTLQGNGFGIAVGPTGTLYVSDFFNNRIVQLNVGTPGVLTFPDTAVGSTATALTSTIMNLGDVALTMALAPAYPSHFPEDSSVSGRCGASTSLTSGQSCVVAADFTPTATGVVSGNIVLTDNSLNVTNATQQVPVSGNGIAPGVTLSTTSISFGYELLGSTSPSRTVTLTNSGQVVLDIAGIAASGDFGMSTTCGSTLAAGASCGISVTFAPSAAGTRNGSITITSNAPSSPDSVSLTGVGVSSTISLSSTSLDFGQTINNQLTSRTLVVTNTGAGELVISGLATTSGYVASSDCGRSVAPGGSCHVLVVFQPTRVGPIGGQLTITSNASNGTVQVALTGTNLALTTGGGAMGEDVIALLAFAAWLRRRMKGRAMH